MKKNYLNFVYSALIITTVSASPHVAVLTGTVKIDGSSTVFPITEAVAEEYRAIQPKVRVNIGVSGTGGGFKKFHSGEIDINNASRKIKAIEQEKIQQKGISYFEIPVAYDGLTIVINKKNDWVENMTVEELKKIWDKDSTVKTWSDIREGWPNRTIKLYGPGTDSGTFDYFTHAINGKSGRSRSGYTKSEDDNVLVKGVIGSRDAMGYFGYAYYKENSNQVKSVKINGIAPTKETIRNGTYAPLSRPVFIYINKKSFAQHQVSDFIQFYLKNALELVEDVGYIPLKAEAYANTLKRIKL